MPESKILNINQSSEEHLNHLVNYLLSLSHKCKSMACYFRKNYSEMYGIADFYQWCAEDLDKTADQVLYYINKTGSHVKLQGVEKPETENFGTPVQSLEYILREDKCLTALLTNIHDFADIKGEQSLKDFLENKMIVPMCAWNKKMEEVIKKLRLANATQNIYELNKTFKNEFNLIKKLREQKLI